MNRRMLGLILALALLTLVLSVALVALFLSVERTQTQIYLDSNDPFGIRDFDFNKGIKVKGSIFVESQADKDVIVWVTDPNGQTILNLDRISQNAAFDFITSDSGIYTFHFDNDFNFLNPKSVMLSFIVEFGFLGQYASLAAWVAFFIAILLALIIGFILFPMLTKKHSTTIAYLYCSKSEN